MIGLRQPWQYYNRPWVVHTVRRRWALNVIIALGQYAWLYYIGCEMLSSPLERIHDLRMSGITCYHHPWTSHTIGRCRGVACPHVPSVADMVGWHPAWDAIISFGQHTWWDEIACYAIIAIRKHTQSDDVRRDMPSLPLDNTHGATTLDWYSIITLGQHIRLENVRRGIPSRLLSRTNGHTTSGVAVNHRH